jgi:hypothetical protein
LDHGNCETALSVAFLSREIDWPAIRNIIFAGERPPDGSQGKPTRPS